MPRKVKLIYVTQSDYKTWEDAERISKSLTNEFNVPVSLSKYVSLALREANEKRKNR